MNTDRLPDVANYVGKLLVESGTEIYRAEEMMVWLCMSLSEVEGARSSVATTGTMFSITVASKTHTKILRVYICGVDLDYINKIDSLSREIAVQNYTIEELTLKLRGIENEQHYSFWIIMFFGALSTGGFVVFSGGNYLEAGCSFLIGLLVRAISALMEQRGLHGLPTNVIATAGSASAALGTHALCPDTGIDILIIFSIMLLVPGLAITNAIRDTVSGGCLSGVTHTTEASLAAIVIAAGIGIVLPMSIGLSGGMWYVSDQYDDCPFFCLTGIWHDA